MTDFTAHLSEWSARGAGALAGSSLSLVYLVPKKRSEAVSRMLIGIIFGLVFGRLTGEMIVDGLGFHGEFTAFEVLLMGTSAASFASWWALGIAVRMLDKTGAKSASRPSSNGDHL